MSADIQVSAAADDDVDDVTPNATQTVREAETAAHGTSSSGAPALVCVLAGICLVRLVTTGRYQRYVRVGMGPILLASGFVLVAAAAATWWIARRTASQLRQGTHGHSHGHGHGRVGVGWLLLLPVLTVFGIAPPGLGSFALARSLSSTSVRQGVGSFTNLVGNAPVAMLLKEFDERAFDRGGASFVGVPVTVIGFVAASPKGGGFVVARFQIACCAADGRANLAHVVGFDGSVPPIDSWVQVTGLFEPGAGDQEAPLLRATRVVPTAQPSDPYEPN